MSGAANRDHRDNQIVDRLISHLRPGQEHAHRVTGPYSGPLPSVAVAARTAGADPRSTDVYRRSVRSVPISRSPLGVRIFVGLSLALGVAMPYWPYGHACGWGLLFYSLGLMTVLTAGVWTSILTWYSRLGISHVLAVLVFAWGVTLGAAEILPRTGLMELTHATWWCGTN